MYAMGVITANLRQRTREVVRLQVADTAFELFVRNGYEQTTVDDIAAAAGISRRSFFRYFSGKEEVVLLRLREHEERMRETLGQHSTDAGDWAAMRMALHVLAERIDSEPETARTLMRMLASSPVLVAAYRARQSEWRSLFTYELVKHLQDPPPERLLAARARVAAALSCLEVAQIAWDGLDGGDHPQTFESVLDAALEAVRPRAA